MDADEQYKFHDLCQSGQIKDLKTIDYSKVKIWFDNYRGLRLACMYGNLDAVKFILNLSKEKNQREPTRNEYNFIFIKTCKSKHLDVIKYLIQIGEERYGKVDIHYMNNLSMINACCYGHLNIAKYLIWLGENGYGRINIHANNDYAFSWSPFYYIQHFLIMQDPNYDWKKVVGYQDYKKERNKLIKNLMVLHQYLVDCDSDIKEFMVLGIIKDYILG